MCVCVSGEDDKVVRRRGERPAGACDVQEVCV